MTQKSFKSPKELQRKIDLYFSQDGGAWVDGEYMPTMSGLAKSIGVSRMTICNYKKDEDYADIILEARAIVEEHLERKLYGNTVTGVIFNLKNNFGWKDKQELDIESPKGSMTPTFVFNPVGVDYQSNELESDFDE